METDLSNLAVLAAILLAAGAAGGLAAGLLGVGGGIVIVPVLFHLFTTMGLDEHVRMHVAVGTSLATIIATSVSSTRSHWRKGAVDIALLKQWGPFILIGVIIGTALAGYVRGPALTGVFAVVASLVAVHMAFGNKDWHIAEDLPKNPLRAVIGIVIGGLSSMMGIGGGTLSVPTLTLFRFPIHRAVGTAAAIGFIIAIPGAIGFILTGWNVEGRPPFSLGYINLLGVALILPTSMTLAPIGAKLAHKLNTQALRRAFAVFLALTAARMFYSILT
ncbi:sulfite exporter TauE/SafE family protein [Magnetospirillum sulfuroxidans]|uniref:Probable membrane transporter protein n=1 Tax=Magnetospirillum sulfuroxidans TaxID=611300 RepID=A0ABS5I7E3_9PROT|nr:sulfite exporter TauE/SafE family protein [Magnetospirillum sulfuroxidans]MBR9970337.1 sulfite exporter TauE/SafE family protein [Magnetospirillum sulfuroxidans]